MVDPYYLIEDLFPIEKDSVSVGYDQALDYICKLERFNIHKYKTGTKCWSWPIPEAWKCYKANIRDGRGNLLFDMKDNPLRIARYSKPINGWFDFQELKEHLFFDIKRPNMIPYVSNPYKPYDWGFCITSDEYKALDISEKYNITIDSEFRNSELKVAEFVIPGHSDQEIIFTAHLDGVCQADYGLSGVATMFSIIHQMKNKKHQYTYRFLIGPQFIGSIAYLSHNLDKLGNVYGAIELDFIGNSQALSAQKTKYDTWEIDYIIKEIEKNDRAIDKIYKYGELVTSKKFSFVGESYVYNGTYVDIPMISLFRLPYHAQFTHLDTVDEINEISMDETNDTIMDIIDIIETNENVTAKYPGPLFLNTEDLNFNIFSDQIDFYKFCSIYDGWSILDIAEEMDLDYMATLEIVKILKNHGLLDTSFSNAQRN